jgi:Putative zinc-finger
MDCKQLSEVLDCYVDGELSPDAMAGAEMHVRGCAQCARAVAYLNGLRAQVRRTVSESVPPQELSVRVRESLRAKWRSPLVLSWARLRWPAAAALLFAVGAVAFAATSSWFGAALASTIDRAVVGLDETRHVTFEGTLLCRDCELEKRGHIRALCPTIGHHGALATSDGRLWSIVEQPASSSLIHNSDLLGARVRAHGRRFRGAGSFSVEKYEVLGPADRTPTQVTRAASTAIQ